VEIPALSVGEADTWLHKSEGAEIPWGHVEIYDASQTSRRNGAGIAPVHDEFSYELSLTPQAQHPCDSLSKRIFDSNRSEAAADHENRFLPRKDGEVIFLCGSGRML